MYNEAQVSRMLTHEAEDLRQLGFVEKGEDWIYSSAGDYDANRKGLIELTYV